MTELRRSNFVNGKEDDRGVSEFARRNMTLVQDEDSDYVQEEESDFEINDEIVEYLKTEMANSAKEYYKLATLMKKAASGIADENLIASSQKMA